MSALPVYIGAHRRQVGGAIFGGGFRQAIPAFFNATIKPALRRLGKRIGAHALRAGIGAATDFLTSKTKNTTSAKTALKRHAVDQFNAFKRQYKLLEEDDEERQDGGAKRRKVIKKLASSNKNKKSKVKKKLKHKSKAIQPKRLQNKKKKKSQKKKRSLVINKKKPQKW